MPRKINLTPEQAQTLIQHFAPNLSMVRLLGSGSFGQVFLVEDQLARVAVKIIPLKLRHNNDTHENHEWQQLTTHWDRLNHASLVRIRSFHEFTDPDPAAAIERYGLIFMDYWPIDLHDYIRRLIREGKFTPARKRILLRNLALLLHRLLADTGLIVTDLKLENILVAARDPGPMELALIDLGGVCEARLADYYRVISTDFYQAPELNDHSVTRIDEKILQFSFGLVGFFILEGRWPVADHDYLQPILLKLRAQGGQLNWSTEVTTGMPGCATIIERCLKEDRAARFPDLAALVAALDAERSAWEASLRHQTIRLIQENGVPHAPQTKKGPFPSWQEPTTGMTLVWIPPGGFDMGQSPRETELLRQTHDEAEFNRWYGRELPRHRVMLDGFWMGKFPVTQGEFRHFVEETLHLTDVEQAQFAARTHARLQKEIGWHHWKQTRYPSDENHPVIHVSWFDARRFAAWLAQRTGLDFSLPSEAQWEYACHGGGTTAFHFGPLITTGQANFDGHTVYGEGQPGVTRKGTTPCGQFPANAYGLHDLHGNVWEWCEDLYDIHFYATPAARQRNPLHSGLLGYRIKRGGSWRSPPALVRAAYRGGTYPNIGKDDIGFRLILRASPPVPPARKKGSDQ
ncbi:MAG: SUMF1/EgtB/PvdO family nonheme iron enzyme [Magnetococcales bacterium]|nr:SUMF1/EgtB/PvdO family nonheme iron enzyme [Magnetococcales bacterium]